ncbi:DUF935 domain-containing protein [Citrobacter portucalensis]|uniref:DUF935 domain-containing protein n=1 Tax=Citrobacter portucalensis TaxID=1639133 RepID=UPI00226B1158|nr:DUF935 family protein [Citrobacter portucalensis]MCX9038492.1 DUF935 domain-containing protein [Citrobacter portucalensis]
MANGIWVSPTEFRTFSSQKKALAQAIATRERSQYGWYGFMGALPNPDPILRAMGRSIEIYRELRSDPLVGSAIRRRKSAVKGLERGLKPEEADDAVVAFVEDMLAGWDIDRIAGELQDGAFYGYQPAELTWESRRGKLVISKIEGKPPEWFDFDTDNQLRFLSRGGGLAGELLPPRKFVLATQDATYDNPYGFPDLSMCFWPVTFKKGGWSFWMKFTERYGTPWLVGKHPRGTSQGEINNLLDSLEAMVEDAVAAIPDDSSVSIVESAGKGDSSGNFKDVINMARSEISIALLGQNQTTEASANKASATAGLEVTADIRDGDAAMIVSAINQSIRYAVELNFGDVACPLFRMWEQEAVDEVQATRDAALTQAGARFSNQYFQREYNLEDGDLLPPTAGAAGVSALSFAEAAADHDLNAQDQLDHALDQLMKSGELDNVLKPVLAPLFAAVRDGASPTALMGQLAELYPAMNADDLRERLARILFVAKVWGRLNAGTQ